mmetsp:Transcript_2946/g.7111  ORF Transcript_2946/g.7111 Transcript_2946/m.7111 type:complete len:104 (+) Transcript_2946:501-812(+)
MRLFLESQVRLASEAKHGGGEDVLEELRDEATRRRILRRQEKRVGNRAKEERARRHLRRVKERIDKIYGSAASSSPAGSSGVKNSENGRQKITFAAACEVEEL